MGSSNCCSKFVLFAVNILFILCGAAILGTGVYLKVDSGQTLLSEKAPAELVEVANKLSAGAVVLIAFGALVFLISICGCCGAMMENQFLLGTYIFFVSVVIAAELGAGVYVYVKRDELEDIVKKPFVKYLSSAEDGFYSTPANNATDLSYIYTMQTLKCCGYNNKSDFNSNVPKKGNFPTVCCKFEDGWEKLGYNFRPAPQCPVNKRYRHEIGCRDVLLEYLNEYSVKVIGVAAAIAALELLVLLTAICFCCNLRKSGTEPPASLAVGMHSIA